MKNKITYSLILGISIVCLIASIILFIEDLADDDALCTAISDGSECNLVQQSKYSKTFGVSNAIYGIFGFSLMILLSVLQLIKEQPWRKYLIIAGAFIAGIMALWFIYVQFSILHAYCSLCMIVDALSVIMMAFSLLLLAKK